MAACDFLLEIAMFTLSITACEIFTVEMFMTLTFRMGQSQMYICHLKRHMRLPVLAIAIFALSVIVCEMMADNLPKVLYSNLWL